MLVPTCKCIQNKGYKEHTDITISPYTIVIFYGKNIGEKREFILSQYCPQCGAKYKQENQE